MSLLDKIEAKETKKISKENREAIKNEVRKLREYEKLGLIGE